MAKKVPSQVGHADLSVSAPQINATVRTSAELRGNQAEIKRKSNGTRTESEVNTIYLAGHMIRSSIAINRY